MESKRPLRVLYVDAGIGLAGGQYGLIELLRNLDGAQVKPTVASPPGSGVEEFCREADIPRVALPFSSIHGSGGSGSDPRLTGRLSGALRGVGVLRAAVRGHDIDIIHANTFRAGLVAGLAARLSGRPMVYQDRTLFGHVPVGYLLWSMATRIVVISKAVAAKYPGVYLGKIRLVPDMVDVERFRPRPGGAGGACGVVGYLGRISPEKGLIHLVRAAPLVLEGFPAARFVIGGIPFTEEGEQYLEKVRSEIDGLGLSGRFDFTGLVQDAPGFLGDLSILVLPSEKEGSGTIILEAMATGIPVVAFDTGGQRELIADGVDGYLVGGLNPEGLAEAIVRVLADPGAAKEMGERGREKVMAGYESPAACFTYVYKLSGYLIFNSK